MNKGGLVLSFDDFLKRACPELGLNWSKYRRRSARRRVESRMREIGMDGFSSYLELIKEDPAEAAMLPDLMRVTVSRFFRERKLWDELAENALPNLLDQKQPGDTVRVWSAGCCGGEEPYTFAIVWLDRLQPGYPGLELEVLATDIDEASLKRAIGGRYTQGSLREVPAATLERWFSFEKGLWNLDERVKRLIRFERSNLLTDPPPRGMDIVLCRYLAFTYYRGERLLSAAMRLHEALRPGGLLMIGRKELLAPPVLEFFRPLEGLPGFCRRL
jgi:chemotaxis protein methyltransferase CheR